MDGNKRTGLGAADLFLHLNELEFKENESNDFIYHFITKVASGQSSLEECRTWFKDNVVSNLSQS